MKTAKTPQTQRVSHRSISLFRVLCVSASLWLLALTATAVAQSGRATVSGRRTITLHVLAQRVEDPNKPKSLLAGSGTQNEEQDKVIPKSALELFDGGVRQKIEAFAPDPTPARIVVLMDNSLTLQADVSKLASVPAAFAPEIYEGDKVMVIGYDLKPEIITDFTDEPKQLQNTKELLRKTDQPHLFDAMNVVMEDVMRPEVGFSKRVIVIVGDGLDRDSKIKFDELLTKLQNENVTVYALQVRDRTRGALRKDAPKAGEALKRLTDGTGGRIFKIEDDVKQSVKAICDELRNDRYQLTYYPEGINPINKRELLLSTSDQTLRLRLKGWHPPVKQ
ncbi:MAG TPA: vWA domain-containing protein [Blastocatellia bacterium]|nr:vWA domain-containing protein [Blastocatellia bacterium]HMX24905.1 vWA domain-containing protein [Blastocatellia bacterium]HMZ16320.1 vWA domain-containing protein [Blastocatellia bacterium]HNG28881.1 vWA domain-containing protein [Blastocatellia bacterium]